MTSRVSHHPYKLDRFSAVMSKFPFLLSGNCWPRLQICSFDMVPEGSGGSDWYQILRQIMLNVQRCVTMALKAVKELYLAISEGVVLLAFWRFYGTRIFTIQHNFAPLQFCAHTILRPFTIFHLPFATLPWVPNFLLLLLKCVLLFRLRSS